MGFRKRHPLLLMLALFLVFGLAQAGIGPVIPFVPDYQASIPTGKDKEAEFIATDWPDFQSTAKNLPSEYIKLLIDKDIDVFAFESRDGTCKKLDLHAMSQSQLDPKYTKMPTKILIKMDAIRDAHGDAYPLKSPDLEGKTMQEVSRILKETKHLEYMLIGPYHM